MARGDYGPRRAAGGAAPRRCGGQALRWLRGSRGVGVRTGSCGCRGSGRGGPARCPTWARACSTRAMRHGVLRSPSGVCCRRAQLGQQCLVGVDGHAAPVLLAVHRACSGQRGAGAPESGRSCPARTAGAHPGRAGQPSRRRSRAVNWSLGEPARTGLRTRQALSRKMARSRIAARRSPVPRPSSRSPVDVQLGQAATWPPRQVGGDGIGGQELLASAGSACRYRRPGSLHGR